MTKYAHHIRFLTCGNELFHVRYDCILYRLVEIHYVAKVFPTSAFFSSHWAHATRHLDLGPLVILMAANPSLRSVSVENINVGNVWACPHLFKFTEFLKRFPSITCVYLDGNLLDMDTKYHRTYDSTVDVLQTLLARVNSSRVKKLVFKHGKDLMRSNRGRSLSIRAGEVAGGDESNSVAVVEQDGVLQVCVPAPTFTWCMQIVSWYSTVEHLHAGSLWLTKQEALQVLSVNNPHLRTIDLQISLHKQYELAWLLSDKRVPQSSLSLRGIERSMFTDVMRPLLLQPTPHFLRNALVMVSINPGTSITSSLLLEILAVCSNLHTLEADYIWIDGTEPERSPVWASRRLRVFYLNMVFEGSGFNDRYSHQEKLHRATASAVRIAPTFMGQLKRQKDLQVLRLVDTHEWFWRSIFVEMTLATPKNKSSNGIQQLAELSRLEELAISRTLESIGPTELAWMAIHWRCLRSVQVVGLRVKVHPSDVPDFEQCSCRMPHGTQRSW